ncbi:hypothetical protein [Paenibacillus prosopidis]|uniref:Uncharacterized protein n=1 Tax=Paenibacillus prosopidis TaxID=630520 RepID=A0A368VKA1_9BACL|nr:hypothetical protein [Paenibacillus prosopidis]RCW41807.1 hypothetical protein DFP97_12191 [Paenibacillus prosopidis]
MGEHVICPWCLTEIVWDEELGPEELCPHCGSELSNYRSVQLGLESDEQQEDLEEEYEEEAHEEEDYESTDHKRWLEQGEGYRSGSIARIAVESTVQRIVDDQEEAPECPACREYMIKAGIQTIGDQHFTPAIAPAIGGPVLTAPFQIEMYVCPACFNTSSLLSQRDREQMLERLTPSE